MKDNANECAFPFAWDTSYEGKHSQCELGMSKREYMAAMAMQGFLSNSTYAEFLKGNDDSPVPEFLARKSIECADELLKQLDQ